ncbi:MAG: FadR/GntR family transcriptional regulator [Tissierellia bacterium]|nr:FadR/GntR family transcriptional regulator [Tissierellia bacterium]MDD4780397.1 FadR/GntR family transcriptional regulator [Tissierellia bacterium]
MENLFSPIKSKKAYMQIVEGILDLINKGEIEYGDKLYSEPELTSILNVSRPTLREALRVLEFLGIVSVSPRKGIRINKPESTSSYMPLIYVLMFEKTKDIELFELRRSLQISMAEIGATNRSSEDLRVLEEIVKKNETHINDDYEIFAKIDYDFHMQIVKCAGNAMCYKLMETLNILMKKQLNDIIEGLPLEERKTTVYYHNKIFECIRDKNPKEAMKYMYDHLERPYNFYKNKE